MRDRSGEPPEDVDAILERRSRERAAARKEQGDGRQASSEAPDRDDGHVSREV
jgi:hypothetical protein